MIPPGKFERCKENPSTEWRQTWLTSNSFSSDSQVQCAVMHLNHWPIEATWLQTI
jgi:hypothetical protein